MYLYIKSNQNQLNISKELYIKKDEKKYIISVFKLNQIQDMKK